MEISYIFSDSFSSSSFLIALLLTAICCCYGILSIRLKPNSPRSDGGDNTSLGLTCDCICSCEIGTITGVTTTISKDFDSTIAREETHSNGGVKPAKLALVERQTGASMMEQLVPEITTYMLSYLDYPSLCRLSMTNSVMRKAANDDNAWKALYRKDFALEQNSITPVNGWKAYYAVTKAILNANTEFYNLVRDRSLQGMGSLWLNADYVKCIHNSGEYFSGYNAVMGSWELAFNWEGVDFEVQDRCIRVVRDMAWVTMKTYVENTDEVGGPPYRCNAINIFEFSNGRWHLVNHHSSILQDGEHPFLLG
ncbi:F-box protein SKIP8-like [Impatiens glandulifera]|uniref:F-box protein SKIP8-like n=1 Tax=Impatiens glandulifera TaxID=253017 RepID=UPI001FB13E42|nr:F-box protein SKIP8-like [Impatiens glandulifera]